MSILNSGIVPVGSTGYSIDNSLRFNDDDSAYLSRTPGTAGTSETTFTVSTWVKRGDVSASPQSIWDTAECTLQFHNDGRMFGNLRGTVSGNLFWYTDAYFRDTSAWYHIVAVYDTTQATDTNRFKLYVNGVLQTFSSISYPAQNQSMKNATVHYIGQEGTTYYMDGLLAEYNMVDGQALTPADFGETDETYGHWKPIEYAGTYGTNGFYLDFSNSGSLGTDASSNTNNWTVNNLQPTDQMLDSPTNNFCTLNPLIPDTTSRLTFSEGNLKAVEVDNGVNYPTPRSSIGVTSGKWYSEFIFTTSTVYYGVAVVNDSNDAGLYPHATAGGYGYFKDGLKKSLGTSTAYGDTFTTGDVIGAALDMDNGNLFFYKNGVVQNSGTAAFTGLSGNMRFAIYLDAATGLANFGQDSSFAGNKTAQGNQDSNSIGDFYYTPPTDFLALCTSNLPDPAVIPSEHFNTVLYTGTGGTNAITGVGFAPDFVWAKYRSASANHSLFDKIRGATKRLYSNTTNAENTHTGSLTSFDSDGFTMGSAATTNESGQTYVAWNWKANGAGVSNTNGTITSTVSANADAGFSIVSYTHTGNDETVGHGLSKAPEMVIIKGRNVSTSWYVLTTLIDGSLDYLLLESTAAKGNLGYSSPTANTFPSLQFSNGNTAIAYCFHSVEGYSKVGSYTGNGSADGTFVHCGFRPAYVMVKDTENSSWPWWIHDTARNPINPSTKQLSPNSSAAEYDDATYTALGIVSNGFKWRTSEAQVNANGETFIYIAFAENPFKYTNAR